MMADDRTIHSWCSAHIHIQARAAESRGRYTLLYTWLYRTGDRHYLRCTWLRLLVLLVCFRMLHGMKMILIISPWLMHYYFRVYVCRNCFIGVLKQNLCLPIPFWSLWSPRQCPLLIILYWSWLLSITKWSFKVCSKGFLF